MSSPHHLLIRGIISLLLIPVLLGSLVSPLSAQQDPRALDPSDVFFQAWLEIQRAEKLEKAGKHTEAWQKYRLAAKYYDVLNRYHKNWKPHLVQGRVESTKASIKLIEPKAAAQLAGKNAKTRDLVEGGPNTKPNTPGGTGQERKPITPRPAVAPPMPRPPVIATTDPALQRELKKLELDNQMLRHDLKKARNTATATRKNPAEEQRLIGMIAKKDREIEVMRDLLARAPLQKEMDRVIQENVTREREIAITARALKESKRKREEAEKSSAKNKAELDLAVKEHARIQQQMQAVKKGDNVVIQALRKDLKAVTTLLETTRQELGRSNARLAQMQRSLDESQSTIEELTEERNALRIERDALANILKKSDSKGVQKLITENMRLGRELKEALDRLQFVETNHNATKDDLLQAKSDLAIAKTRIMRYQQDQANHGKMIKSLESQLRDAQAQLSEAQVHPSQNASQEEIETLKGTVKRLVAAQERRKMGEKILWEAYQQSKTTIAGMAEAFKDIRDTKVELTEEEKRIVALRHADGEFRNPERVPLAHARAHGDALAKEIQYVEGLVFRHVEKGRLDAAQGILIDINERVPGNYRILCNLGVVDFKKTQYNEAIQCFDEAITMQENSGYAHFMLGLAQYKSNDLDNASNSFKRSLDLKPGNARAHLYLGNIAGAGRRYKQAEEHFQMAIELEPTNPDTYFNLSVLHLLQKRKKDALESYRKALDNGAQPDPTHEQKLSS